MGIGSSLKKLGKKVIGKEGMKALAVINPVMAIGTLLAGGDKVLAGISENNLAKDQARALGSQAQQEVQMAQDEATAIRERGRRFIAQQRAALVDSGVRLDGGGSVDVIQNDTRTLAEQDAIAAIQTGNYRATALREQGDLTKKQGKAALVGGIMSGVSSAVNLGAMAFGRAK